MLRKEVFVSRTLLGFKVIGVMTIKMLFYFYFISNLIFNMKCTVHTLLFLLLLLLLLKTLAKKKIKAIGKKVEDKVRAKLAGLAIWPIAVIA